MIWLVLILLLLLLSTSMNANAAKISNTFGNRVFSEATSWNIPPVRILAMIQQESAGDPTATGKIGEVGLMQLTSGALSDVNRRMGWLYTMADLYDPDTNIKVGVAYLALLRLQFSGDLDKATQAYNAGAGAVKADPDAGAAYLAGVKAKETHFV